MEIMEYALNMSTKENVIRKDGVTYLPKDLFFSVMLLLDCNLIWRRVTYRQLKI